MYEDEFKRWTREDAEKFCEDEFIGDGMDVRLCKLLTGCQAKVESIKPVQMNPENNLGVLTVHILVKEE